MQRRYRIVVRRSLLRQDQWGLHFIPADRPEFDFLDSCGYPTAEVAADAAKNLIKIFPQAAAVVEGDVAIDDSPRRAKGEYENVVGDEKTIRAFLEAHLKDAFEQTNKLRPSKIKLNPKEWLPTLLLSPFALALMGIFVYFFDFPIPAPEWLQTFLPKGINSSSQFAIAIPFLMCIAVVRVIQVRRSSGYEMNTLRNYLLTLVLKHGWRLEHFADVAIKEAGKLQNAALAHLIEGWMNWDPDAFRNLVGRGQQAGDAKASEMRELYLALLANDFERRVHALLFLEKEAWFTPTRIGFDPLACLMAYETRAAQFAAIKHVLASGGTATDVARAYAQAAAYRSSMHYLGALIGGFVVYGLIAFALYLGISEAARQSLNWYLAAAICGGIALAFPLLGLYRVYFKGDGRPTGFQIWEIGLIRAI